MGTITFMHGMHNDPCYAASVGEKGSQTRRYQRLVFSRALADTKAQIKRLGLHSAALLGLLGLAAYFVWNGGVGVRSQVPAIFTFVFAPIGLAVVGSLCWNLLRAPARIYGEQEELLERMAGARVRLGGAPYSSPTRSAGSPFFNHWVWEISEVADGIMLSWRKFYRLNVPKDACCSVEDPYGNHHPAKVTRTGQVARAIFPRDFGVRPEPGMHRMYWFAPIKQMHFASKGDEDRVFPAIDPVPFAVELEERPQ